ncbi:hypothetical protein K493DRAFT_5029 [Basidiobolus meristosporus CBS 931.73]|uniref:Uncharacterized protein n=1 Tax=Basidiobolus meristosporus CBS 931.73 TaxID=1314790 RepID=A0A1Y1YL35_9FUNG|nr:hypothetical protein K493DRAFT_5029 [Basidiobolus meristosporus CBS 931.73]|eukprot:ORX98702.1 hypothetical protein K493DRAFT_5029 [Basidiobolus meristosporus CBS 931.73]
MAEMDDVVRAIADTSLKLLIDCRYTELLGMSSDELFQRVQVLSEPENTKEQEFQLFQWNHGISYEELASYKNELDYTVPVRYRRFDPNDLRAFVEIQKRESDNKEDLGIVLRLEEGWVYFDIRRGLDSQDSSEWRESIEEAEEEFRSADLSAKKDPTMEEAEDDYWAQYGESSDDADQEQTKETRGNEEIDYWSQYDQVNAALDQTEVDTEPYRGFSRDEDKAFVELEVSDDFLRELDNIEKEELLSNEGQPGGTKEKEDDFIKVSASESKITSDGEDEATSTVQLTSKPDQEISAQHSSSPAPTNPPHPQSIAPSNSEMASRLDLTTMLTFAMGNINNMQAQQAQWKPLILQLLRTSRDMAKLAGLSDVELSELLHDAYGDVVPNL